MFETLFTKIREIYLILVATFVNMTNFNKKDFETSIVTFYSLNHDKGKFYTFLHFKKLSKDKKLHKATIYRILRRYDDQGHIDRKSGSGRPRKCLQVI